MTKLKNHLNDDEVLELTPEIKKFLTHTRKALKGSDRRIFMAETVGLLGN